MLEFPSYLTDELARAFATDHGSHAKGWKFIGIQSDATSGRLLATFRAEKNKVLTVIMDPTDFHLPRDVPNSSSMSNLGWYIIVLADEHIFGRTEEFPLNTEFRLRHQGHRDNLSDYQG